jgi:hypothetical protein
LGFLDEVIENAGEPYKGGKGFEYGTHEVIIGTVEAKAKDTKKQKGAAIIEVIVFDEADNDKTANCTLWFHTEGAAKMSVTKALGIMVHNVGEEKKDKVRELGKKLFASVDAPEKARDVVAKLMNDKMIGYKAYVVAEPNGEYKTTSYGDLWHYPAVPQGETSSKAQAVAQEQGGSVVDTEDIPDFEDL